MAGAVLGLRLAYGQSLIAATQAAANPEKFPGELFYPQGYPQLLWKIKLLESRFSSSFSCNTGVLESPGSKQRKQMTQRKRALVSGISGQDGD